jgi:hypothetical protein
VNAFVKPDCQPGERSLCYKGLVSPVAVPRGLSQPWNVSSLGCQTTQNPPLTRKRAAL